MPDFLPPAPVCVPVFKGDNGGATSEGVTGSQIRVVVFLNAADPLLGDTGDTEQQIRVSHETYRRYFNLHRETFRREVVFDYFKGSGLSQEAYRADAISIAQNHKPFAVMVAEGEAPIAFTEEINARGIICICQNGQSREYYRQYPGKSFGLIPSVELTYDHLAEYVAKRLAGDRAEFAGPPPPGEGGTYNNRRRFGLVFLNSGTDGVPVPSLTRAADRFEADLARRGAKLSAKVSYSFDVTRFQSQATNIITQLREGDVTSILLVTDFIIPISLTDEAQRQGYNPEWINGDYLITSYTQAGRFYNQEQWGRSFGISPLPLAPANLPEDPLYQILLETGGQQTYGPGYANYGYDTMTLFDGIHYAGPKLTRTTFAQGLFVAPARAGTNLFPRVKYSIDDPVLLSDFTEIWWDANATGPDEVGKVGKGVTRRVDGGKRYTSGKWPDAPPAIRQRDPNPVTVRPKSPLQQHAADGHKHAASQRCRSCAP